MTIARDYARPASAGTARSRRLPLAALLASVLAAVPLAASAQSGSAQSADPVAPFLGTWSGVFTTQENDYWTFADIQCFVGCPLDFYNHLSKLLADPANDKTPAMALGGQANEASLATLDAMLTPLGKQVRAANKPENDPKFVNCQPYGFVREVINPLPMQIRRDGDHLVIHYEEWSLFRNIYLDGRPHPTHKTPTLLGHSVGRVENGALVVDTALLTPDLISDATQAGHSGELTAVERYVIHDKPRRLEVTLTLTDPVMFTKPLVMTKTWLYTPDVEIVLDSCSQQPGKP
ncbi:MAG TPA: hypothetical protein VFO94_16015 [Gammaproteobacteria bacterium]|nr:hypothetical protein [Gammaproteobacteria bacterium]